MVDGVHGLSIKKVLFEAYPTRTQLPIMVLPSLANVLEKLYRHFYSTVLGSRDMAWPSSRTGKSYQQSRH
jgi:hypothetical protein